MVAHVDRVWNTSLINIEPGQAYEVTKSDITPFLKLLTRLMQGGTAGMAMEDLNRRYSFFTTSLADELVGINFYGRSRDQSKLLQMMIQTIDARNYILIGDPAVRLPVRADQPYQPPPDDWERPAIGAVSAPSPVEQAPQPGAPPIETPLEGAEAPGETVAPPQPEPAIPTAEGINLDNLASALIKGQKLKLSDYK
jgi:hypothetical protein